MVVGIVGVRVEIHAPCHERAGGAFLNHRLVVRRGIRELSSVEKVVGIGNEGVGLHGRFQINLTGLFVLLAVIPPLDGELGPADVETVDTHVHPIAATCRTDGEVAALVAAHIDRVAQSVAPIAGPETDVS